MKYLLIFCEIMLLPIIIHSEPVSKYSKFDDIIEIAKIGDKYYKTGKGTINYEYICVDSLGLQTEGMNINKDAKLVTYMNHTIDFAFSDNNISCIVYDNQKSRNIAYEKWIYDGETTWLLRTRKGKDNIYVPGGFIYNGLEDYIISEYDIRSLSSSFFYEPIASILKSIKDGYLNVYKLIDCKLDSNILLNDDVCIKIELLYNTGNRDQKIALFLSEKKLYRIKRFEIYDSDGLNIEKEMLYNDNDYIPIEIVSKSYNSKTKKLQSIKKWKRNNDWVFNEVINDNVFDNNIFIEGQWVYDTRIKKRYKH